MRHRLFVVIGSFLFFFIVILVRLFFWQVLSFDILKGLADSQIFASQKIPAKRGHIFSNDGSPLAINQNAYLIYAEPQKIKNITKTSEVLSGMLGIDTSTISAKLSQNTLDWVSIAQKVNEELADKIRTQELEGIGFFEETKRFYPEASMAAHILGFVGKNLKGEDQGYFGIEGYYDEQLKGREGIRKQENDALGNPIILGNSDIVPAENGRDLYLTIDKTAQYIVENKLNDGIEKYEALGGTVIVMDPKTGAIIAMASYPSYDPMTYYEYPSEDYKNPAVAMSYEPGSTFKVLVMAMALDEESIEVDTKYHESGPIEIGGYTIETWNDEYHGEISISQILEYSSNVGMVFIQRQMGNDTLIKRIYNFGFGEKTGIDLQEESSPDIREKNKWYEIDFATSSFGQGIAVTPLQMIRAVGAIANGGKLMKPYIVKKIQVPNGKEIDISSETERTVISQEVASVVSEMMVNAVEYGETRFIKPSGYTIAGKTGTAQIPISGHYDEEKTIASFVGFAPVYDPKFVMLVTLREPAASPWGSETAAPIFFDIAGELFSYYGISPGS